MATAWAVVFAAFDMRKGITVARDIHQTVMPRFSAARMKQLAFLSLPLGVVTMLISFNANIPRYMISHYRSVSDLGVFSALGYLPIAGTLNTTS
jgi:O-antigen/teichoic acid export membrane protein